MNSLHPTDALWIVGALLLAWSLRTAWQRLTLSRAKHPSLAGHVRLSRWLARQLPYYAYDEAQFFSADRAPDGVVAQRRAGFQRLSALYAQRFARSAALTEEAASGLSDLQLTARYRVPFQFAAVVRRHLRGGSFLVSSEGPLLTDADGNRLFDLTGSYGVNLFGYDFYKDCIERGSERVRALGPVLGSYHPVVLDNVRRLRALSQLDEVSFHMSGTEAVMQAVRLARYHTRRRYLVRFCGAYHGWWGDVAPGSGNPARAPDTLTLRELDAATLQVLRQRRDVACVLVNPLQALHPNRAAPSDSTLLDSSRQAHFDRAAYTAWLRELRAVCSSRGIALILDEVFLGFRLARGGAQEYFGVRADLVTYGKTIAGGLPVGVLCGRQEWMRRFRSDRPADVNLARGTFNAHPYVMGAMQQFLQRLDTPEVQSVYDGLDARWNARAAQLNARLAAEGLNARIEQLSSVWTICYPRASRYNWMFQYYLRAQGLALSWVGTGRLIFSLDYGDAEFAAVADRFMAAARQMQQDGWWWEHATLSNRAIRRQVWREIVRARLPSGRSAPRAAAAAALDNRA